MRIDFYFAMGIDLGLMQLTTRNVLNDKSEVLKLHLHCCNVECLS